MKKEKINDDDGDDDEFMPVVWLEYYLWKYKLPICTEMKKNMTDSIWYSFFFLMNSLVNGVGEAQFSVRKETSSDLIVHHETPTQHR